MCIYILKIELTSCDRHTIISFNKGINIKKILKKSVATYRFISNISLKQNFISSPTLLMSPAVLYLTCLSFKT